MCLKLVCWFDYGTFWAKFFPKMLCKSKIFPMVCNDQDSRDKKKLAKKKKTRRNNILHYFYSISTWCQTLVTPRSTSMFISVWTTKLLRCYLLRYQKILQPFHMCKFWSAFCIKIAMMLPIDMLMTLTASLLSCTTG